MLAGRAGRCEITKRSEPKKSECFFLNSKVLSTSSKLANVSAMHWAKLPAKVAGAVAPDCGARIAHFCCPGLGHS